MHFSEGILQGGALCAGLCTHLQLPPITSTGHPSGDLGAPGSPLFLAIGGTSGFTFPSLRAQFSALGMPKIQVPIGRKQPRLFWRRARYLSTAQEPRGVPWPTLQSPPHSAAGWHRVPRELKRSV